MGRSCAEAVNAMLSLRLSAVAFGIAEFAAECRPAFALVRASAAFPLRVLATPLAWLLLLLFPAGFAVCFFELCATALNTAMAQTTAATLFHPDRL
jgi:hypothetical protein